MWFPIFEHGESVIEARHDDGRWRFRRRVTTSDDSGSSSVTRGEATTGLAWLLEQGGPGPLDGLHTAARRILREAREYALREQRTAWWMDEVESLDWFDWTGIEDEELAPPRLPWNAHVVHHHELLGAWRARNAATLPLVDLEPLALTGAIGAAGDDAWERYLTRLHGVMHDGTPGPPEVVARFASSLRPPAPAAVATTASLLRDAWHWGLALGEDADDEAIVLPPPIGAELAWRHASCLVERHRAALAEDVVMLARALRYVPDPRAPFAVLVHGKCLIRARWRLGVWEWSSSYSAHSEGYWRRGDFQVLLRSDLLHLGPPTYLHPVVAPLLRDAFELAVSRRGDTAEGGADSDDATWRELLAWAEAGQVVDCLVRDADLSARSRSW